MLDNADGVVSVLAVGDIMPDIRLRPPRMFLHQPGSAACSPQFRPCPTPFINTAESREWLARQGVPLDGLLATSHAAQSVELDLPAEASDPRYPFQLIAPDLRRADLVFGNLECPLSDRGRPVRNDMCYRAAPSFARALAEANFKVVSFSNNHCMDYGEVAFSDTLDALRHNGVEVAGAGQSYEEASRPVTLEVGGTRLAFLAYNFIGPDVVYALHDEGGVIPLNEMTIEQTAGRVRGQADVVFASVHWGREELGPPGAEAVRLAHQLVDAGVDVVLGHHSHVPGSIEIYKSKPIFYSLGNFIFGHTHNHWTDNIMARLVLAGGRVSEIEIIPVGSLGAEQYQPVVLRGERAADVLEMLSVVSTPFGTQFSPSGHCGTISLHSDEEVLAACDH